MDSLLLGLSLLSLSSAAVIMALLVLIARMRRRFYTILFRQQDQLESFKRELQEILQSLREVQGKQAGHINRLVTTHLSLKQDLLTLESKLARSEDQNAETGKRGPHLLH